MRVWVANMILASVLERVPNAQSGRRFTVKGGVALELRLRDRARATKDIDLAIHDLGVDTHGGRASDVRQVQTALVGALEDTVTAGTYQGFAFRRKGEPILLENGTVSLELGVTYHGEAWTSIIVDLARAEAGEKEVELLPAISLTEALGVTGPAELPCLALRFHIAQKLHGMTLPPRKGKRNERFKDLVDLLLMEELLGAATSPDLAGVREACEIVFSSRATHPWPPVLDVASHWKRRSPAWRRIWVYRLWMRMRQWTVCERWSLASRMLRERECKHLTTTVAALRSVTLERVSQYGRLRYGMDAGKDSSSDQIDNRPILVSADSAEAPAGVGKPVSSAIDGPPNTSLVVVPHPGEPTGPHSVDSEHRWRCVNRIARAQVHHASVHLNVRGRLAGIDELQIDSPYVAV